MTFHIVTLFPDMFTSVLSHSILKRAQEKQHISFTFTNIRDFAPDKYKTVDDHPYGGSVGMVMKVDVMHKALLHVQTMMGPKHKTILLTPSGSVFSQQAAQELTTYTDVCLLVPHYEGYDERITKYVDAQISIGDYILTGAEIPAMVIIDAVTRLIPGVLTKETATQTESFSESPYLLEYPQYTRPQEYDGEEPPSILLSGDHKKITDWRKEQSITRTQKIRPDLYKKFTEQQKDHSS